MRTGAARRPRVQAAEAPTRGGHCQLATAATLMRLLARIISSYTYPSLCICAFTPAWESMDSEADGCAASRHQLSRSAGAGEAELSAIGTRDSAHTSSRRPNTKLQRDISLCNMIAAWYLAQLNAAGEDSVIPTQR